MVSDDEGVWRDFGGNIVGTITSSGFDVEDGQFADWMNRDGPDYSSDDYAQFVTYDYRGTNYNFWNSAEETVSDHLICQKACSDCFRKYPLSFFTPGHNFLFLFDSGANPIMSYSNTVRKLFRKL